VAGNETTRNAISHGMRLLTAFPDQKKIWFDDFETHTRSAVEEIVRYATPVIHFRRTATEDTEISGQKLKAGDKVVMFYSSGNRPHFCLGANLARWELRAVFRALLPLLPRLELVGETIRFGNLHLGALQRQLVRLR